MKLPYAILSLSLFLAKTGLAQIDNDIALLRNNKVVSVTSYYINTVESKVEECLNTPSWYKNNISDSTVYDNKGNVVLYRLYVSDRKSWLDTKIEYNSAGLPIKSTEYNNTKPKSTDSISYNKEGFIAYRKMYYNFSNYLLYESKVEYTFKKGKLPVETRSIDPFKGTVNTTTVKTFDSKDRLTEEILYMGSKEEKKIQDWKKYIYHNASSNVIKEIQTYHSTSGKLYFVQKFDNTGFLTEKISYLPGKEEIRDKTVITKTNDQIVEIYFDYIKEEDRLPASSGNADEMAPMIHGEKAFKPVQKKVTTLLKNGLKEITKTYRIDYAGKESYDRAFKYEYQYSK